MRTLYSRMFMGLFLPAAVVASVDSASPSLAVVEFEAKGITAEEASVITDRFREELHKTKAFTVLERAAMEAILKEQGFQQSGCVSTECAVEVGQMVGVRYMAAGSVGKLGEVYVVSVRLIDVGSGVITTSHSAEVRGAISQVLSVLPRLAREMTAESPGRRHEPSAHMAAPRSPEPAEREQHPAEDSDVRQPHAEEPPDRRPADGRRVHVQIGLGLLYGTGGVTLRYHSLERQNPYAFYVLDSYQQATLNSLGGVLTIGLLLKRSLFNVQVMGMGGLTSKYEVVTPQDSSAGVINVERSGAGIMLQYYYEPLFFRERRFGISPGVAVGIQSLSDEMYNYAESSMSVRDCRYGAALLKMRLGGRRVFGVLEYAFTLGDMKVESEANAWTPSGDNVRFGYEAQGHSNLTFSVVVRL